MLFILERQGKSGGGGYTDGKVVNLETLINIESLPDKHQIRKSDFYGYRLYVIRVVIEGRRLFTLKEISKEEFIELFGDKIDTLGWLLEYYPNETDIRYKYPLFKKEIYSLYGKKCEREKAQYDIINR